MRKKILTLLIAIYVAIGLFLLKDIWDDSNKPIQPNASTNQQPTNTTEIKMTDNIVMITAQSVENAIGIFTEGPLISIGTGGGGWWSSTENIPLGQESIKKGELNITETKTLTRRTSKKLSPEQMKKLYELIDNVNVKAVAQFNYFNNWADVGSNTIRIQYQRGRVVEMIVDDAPNDVSIEEYKRIATSEDYLRKLRDENNEAFTYEEMKKHWKAYFELKNFIYSL